MEAERETEMFKKLQNSLNQLMIVLAGLSVPTNAMSNDDFRYPDEVLVNGQTFVDLLEIQRTHHFTWPTFAEAIAHPHVHFAERRKGRRVISETVRPDQFIFVPHGVTSTWQGASETPCLEDDFDFLEAAHEHFTRPTANPSMWLNGEQIADVNLDAAFIGMSHNVYYRPRHTGPCIDPSESASGDRISRMAATVGYYFVIPPLDSGVYKFEFYASLTGQHTTREFTVLDGLVGDVDRSGALDAADIDLISAGLRDGSVDLLLDRDQNGDVNDVDRLFWVTDSAKTSFGDFDLDGDVDAADRTALTGGWTGALETSDPSVSWADGDADGDFDVDSADLTLLTSNWSGAEQASTASREATAELVYDSTTGNVRIDASRTASQSVISFVLATQNGELNVDAAQLPFDDKGYNTDITATQIGQTDLLHQGAGPIVDLGSILPVGIASDAQLAEYLASAEYASGLGAGGEMRLRVVPEPSALALLLLGIVVRIRARRPIRKSGRMMGAD